jgi:hypothetical protein
MGRVLVVIAAAALLLVAARGEAEPPRSCGPRSAHTVARSDYGRVYESGSRVAACLFRGGRPVVLSEDPDGGSGVSWSPGPFVLAGRFVVFVDGSCQFDNCGGSFEVVDIKRRRVVRTDALNGEAHRIVLTYSGLAAVLARANGGEYYIDTLYRRGTTHVDAGEDLRSLTLEGRVSWLHDGEPRIARLR